MSAFTVACRYREMYALMPDSLYGIQVGRMRLSSIYEINV